MDSGFFLIFNFAGKSAVLDGIGIFLATYLPYFLVLTFIGILLAQKEWRRKIRLFLLSAMSAIVALGIIKQILNYAFFRPRPYVALGLTPLVNPSGAASFPSAHAVFFFTLATIIFFWVDRKWGKYFFVGAVLISVARVFAGVHYPVDVIAGAAIGFITPFLLRYLLPETFGEVSSSLGHSELPIGGEESK